jgi:hypothetical protein
MQQGSAIYHCHLGCQGGWQEEAQQHPYWVTTMTDYNGGNNKKAGNSNVGCILTTARSGQR